MGNTYIDLVFVSGGEPMLADRVKNAPAAFLLAFGLLWFAFELIMRTVGPPIFAAIRQRLGVAEEEFKEGNPSFFEALENQEISGLDNYNIKKTHAIAMRFRRRSSRSMMMMMTTTTELMTSVKTMMMIELLPQIPKR